MSTAVKINKGPHEFTYKGWICQEELIEVLQTIRDPDMTKAEAVDLFESLLQDLRKLIKDLKDENAKLTKQDILKGNQLIEYRDKLGEQKRTIDALEARLGDTRVVLVDDLVKENKKLKTQVGNLKIHASVLKQVRAIANTLDVLEGK